MTDTWIVDRHHLEVVPDGTVISWLRIPGDQTSEALAFVRREVEYDDGPDGPTVHGGPHATVWVSPGGWDPQTIESAGVTFPCHVIRWGDVSQSIITGTELPALVETLESGGSYSRASALDASARFCADTPTSVERMLEIAETFEEWLNRPVPPALKGMMELPDYESPEFEAQADAAVAAYRSWEANEGNAEGLPTDIVRAGNVLPDWWPNLADAERLRVLADETDWAAEVHQINRHVSTRAIRAHADKLDGLTP
jgi:hypothetical protein